MPKRKVTSELIEEMKKLRKQGLPYEKIASTLKLAPMTVYNYLKKEKKKDEKKGFLRRIGLKK